MKGLPAAPAAWVEPMKCKLRASLPEGKEWVYEIKFDGVRALAIKNGRTVELISRNRKGLESRYPAVVRALAGLKHKSLVLDGEVVALDKFGRSSFQLLQNVNRGGPGPDLFYYVFDIISLDGKNTAALPLLQRKQLLEEIIGGKSDCLRLSGFLPADAKTIQQKMSGLGLEGLIAKQKNSPYEPGSRSGAWVKFKWSQEQEFVLGGWTDPDGARKFFGSVLVGYYDLGELKYAAKVGTGFDEKLLRSLAREFHRLSRKECPFADLHGGRGSGLSKAELRRCHWIEPTLVCQVKFAEWTQDGRLRQPVFLGLREDKSPPEVTRETPQNP